MYFLEGQSAAMTRRVTAADVERFAEITGDRNPIHLDPAFAATTRFKRRIAHGLLTASYVSAVLGSELPGPGTIYLSQSLTFKAPVYIDDEITAKVTVLKYRPDKQILTLRTECVNQDGVVVMEGQAVCLTSDIVAEDDQPSEAAS
ncbi:MAG: MaoC family dehydratase [Candidatus Eremiobacteraeota bacterium]|nr:MaoC family dehydratase [Candidatus Eremiobacteraeota bacterium]